MSNEPNTKHVSHGELIAAIPALLGYVPAESAVVVAMRDDEPTIIARTDVADLTAAVAAVTAQPFTRSAESGTTVHIVVIAGAEQPATDGVLPFTDIVDLLAGALSAAGARVADCAWTPVLATGTRWHCYGGRTCGGFLPDPAATTWVRASREDGRLFYASREEAMNVVAPVDKEILDRRTALLASTGRRADRLADIRLIIGWILTGQTPTTDNEVVALALALADQGVRDWCLVHCNGALASKAARLWATLVRETPAPYRAAPATLLAVYAYVAGDELLAMAALLAALEADPGYRLAVILQSAIAYGMTPADLNETIGILEDS